jgi:hypothetical protein
MSIETKPLNDTATKLLKQKANKRYLTIIHQELWDRLVAYQEKFNADPKNVGPVSVNNLIETAIKRLLIEVANNGDTSNVPINTVIIGALRTFNKETVQ